MKSDIIVSFAPTWFQADLGRNLLCIGKYHVARKPNGKTVLLHTARGPEAQSRHVLFPHLWNKYLNS